MESPNNLEISGSLRINPLAELLVEIAHNKFNGSLRLSNEAQKTIVYFDAGEIIFAVSNAREHRLFELLLQAEKITKEQLLAIKDFTNDLALEKNLLDSNLMDKVEIERFFSRQIGEILEAAIAWHDGEWTFSPLARVKGNIRFQVEYNNLLIEYARRLPAEETARKFGNPAESLAANLPIPTAVNLSPRESFVFSRFENETLTIEQTETLSGLPETETLQILYALWLGGFLVRRNQQKAFSERAIGAITSARLTVKRDEVKPAIAPPAIKKSISTAETETKVAENEAANETDATEAEFSLDKYLERTEEATNLYEFFALAPDSPTAEIKRAYFSLAKRFHPDLFYKQVEANLHQRIQTAFTKIAHAYEILKSESSRNVYDFRMRKELAEMSEQIEANATPEEVDEQKQFAQAAADFEQGFNFVMDENYEAAVPFLARAAHFAPRNARYRAYYGKALSTDNKHRHKAESELQTAIKLDGENADYRIMLAEFFMQVGLVKRAEGELNRLLAIFPDNREARMLLDRLRKK